MRSCKKQRQPWPEHRRSQPQNEERQILASVMRQPERKVNWTKPLTMLVVLFLVVSLLWGEVQPCQLSRGNGEPKFRILSASIFHQGPQAAGFFAEC